MNSFPGQNPGFEAQPQQNAVPPEIPEYPVAQQPIEQEPPQMQTQVEPQYVPQQQETYNYQPQPRQAEQVPLPPKPEQTVDLYNKPEQQAVEQSRTPELQTAVEYQTREGERFFQNPEEGQATFKGGVTKQQLVSKVSGYYTVSQGLVNDPHSGLLQQTAQSGDPTSATTWQATTLYKALLAILKVMGFTS